MMEIIKKVTSDDVKNLVSGIVSEVKVREYVDLVEAVRYQIASDIEAGDEVFLVYQDGCFGLLCDEHMQHLFNNSDDDEEVTYHDEDVDYNIELGDYDCATDKINFGIIERLGSEGKHIDMFGAFYVPMEHYIEYCFLTEYPRAMFDTAPCEDWWCAACVDDDDNKLPVSDWYIAVVFYEKYGDFKASDIRVRIGDVREDVGDDFAALENRGQLIIDMLNELSKRYHERLFPKVA